MTIKSLRGERPCTGCGGDVYPRGLVRCRKCYEQMDQYREQCAPAIQPRLAHYVAEVMYECIERDKRITALEDEIAGLKAALRAAVAQ